jgi:hypothetical protein
MNRLDVQTLNALTICRKNQAVVDGNTAEVDDAEREDFRIDRASVTLY